MPRAKPIGRAWHVAQVAAAKDAADTLGLLIAEAAAKAGPGRVRNWLRKFLQAEPGTTAGKAKGKRR